MRVMTKMLIASTVTITAVELIQPRLSRNNKKKIRRYMKVGKSMADNLYGNVMTILD
ncbi:hypothetical protein [Clostridium ihumii]|uniref:hypothetical protein n=1 Tax=Clostridium ihumii TaxID=1470356 RepID=UPI000AA3B33E|nr:hypothetical protein [Clostridium ihumii]